eukprot:TRINITY_DN16399_c0_g1_i1.p1 TRINITY_DN16399_c0_g1~~TRINITY_DN16399_c0_g1_i1.p1  ORF type:complete len:539 (-),score=143.19 TRINITY_DN16399_c0_g1_i1:123-1739(-)
MKHHKKNSKRQKLSLKYNIQKRQRESKRRIRKEAKKLGMNKVGRKKKDPGIPNTWPFKEQMLQELEKKKEKKDAEMAKKRAKIKKQAATNKKASEEGKRLANEARVAAKRAKQEKESAAAEKENWRRQLAADVFIEVLDARDPLGCRCPALESIALEKGKRLIFVLAKSDLISPQLAARWIESLGGEAPVVAVHVEAGREGVSELVRMLGYAPRNPSSGDAAAAEASSAGNAMPQAKSVAVVGYAGTGKKTLVKALRQEMPKGGSATWLLERTGLLKPSQALSDARCSMHLSMRGRLPEGAAWKGSTATASAASEGGPLTTMEHMMCRTSPAAIMRRFRLPACETAKDILIQYARRTNMESNTGKGPAALEKIARNLLNKVSEPPGCCCIPPDAATAATMAAAAASAKSSASTEEAKVAASKAVAVAAAAAPTSPLSLWLSHGTAVKPVLQAMMSAQAKILATREGGPAPSILEMASNGFGPDVDLKAFMTEAVTDDDEDMVDAESDEDMDGEGEDGEEEEGEESEEEDLEMEADKEL